MLLSTSHGSDDGTPLASERSRLLGLRRKVDGALVRSPFRLHI